jgi:hypothetical protein
METIANFPDLASAQVAQSFLEAEGIPSLIPDQFLAGLDWRMCGGIGGVRLQVPPEHVEAAVALLSEMPAFDQAELERLADDASPLDVQETCPACGSSEIMPDASRRRSKALGMLLEPMSIFALALGATRNQKMRCSTCGHTWCPTAIR